MLEPSLTNILSELQHSLGVLTLGLEQIEKSQGVKRYMEVDSLIETITCGDYDRPLTTDDYMGLYLGFVNMRECVIQIITEIESFDLTPSEALEEYDGLVLDLAHPEDNHRYRDWSDVVSSDASSDELSE